MRLYWILIVVPVALDDRVDRNWGLNNCTMPDEWIPAISDGTRFTRSIGICESDGLSVRIG